MKQKNNILNINYLLMIKKKNFTKQGIHKNVFKNK